MDVEAATRAESETCADASALSPVGVIPLVVAAGLASSLAACGGCQFNIEALVSGPVNNVRNALTGATVLSNNEGLFPYTLPGDAGVGNYNGMTLNLGAHTVKATPFLPVTFAAGTPLTVTFTVVP